MKKVLLSLLLAIACMPMAIGQNKAGHLVTTDTTVCSKFLWTVDGVEYSGDTVVLYQQGDTTFVLNLTMLAPNYDTANVRELTGNCAINWNHKVWTEEGTFFDTITPTRGCDTIVRVNITLNGIDTTWQTVTACDKYIFHGDTLTASGEYLHVDTATATTDCHAYGLNLTIVNSFRDTATTVVRDIIGGCRVEWLGTTYTFDDTNTVFYGMGTTTVGGCDSLMAIRITSFTGVQHDTSFVENCGKYRWEANSTTYENGGFYSISDTTPTCIENQYLDLTIVEQYDTVRLDSCYRCTYVFSSREGIAGGRDRAVFMASGVYDADTNGVPLYSTHFNTHCVTYHTLVLTIRDVDVRTRENDVDTVACDKFNFTFANQPFSFSVDVDTTLYYYRHTANYCYDSIANFKVTIKHKSYKDYNETVCDSYYWPFTGETYTASTVQSKVLDSIKNAQGCDSIGRLNLTVNYTPEVSISGNWHVQPGETAHLKAIYNEADHPTFQWYKNNTVIPASQGGTRDSIDVTETSNTDIRLETTSNKGCMATNWITVTFHVGIDDVEGLNVNLYPNPASRFLNVESAEGISYVVVYNAIGQQVIRRDINATNAQLDLGNLAIGTYTMQIVSNNGEQATRKFIVNK